MRLLTTTSLIALTMIASPVLAQEAESDTTGVVFPENPTRNEVSLELQRLRREGVAQYEAGLSLDEATNRFRRAYEISGAADDAFNVALVFFRQNNPEAMKDWLAKALEADPAHPNSLYLLGVQAKEEGDFETARSYWEATVAQYAADAQLNYQLALVQRSLGDEQAFVQSLINALSLDPNHPGALYQMFRHYRTSGNREAADATMKRFTALKRLERFSRREKAKEPSTLTLPIAGTVSADPFMATEMLWSQESAALACEADWAGLVAQPDVESANVTEHLLITCTDGRVVLQESSPRELGNLPEGTEQVALVTFDQSGFRLAARAAGRMMISGPVLEGNLTFNDYGAASGEFRLADIDIDGDVDAVFFDGSLPLINAGNMTFKTEPKVYDGGDLTATLSGAHDAAPLDVRRTGMADFAILGDDRLALVAGDVLGYRLGWEQTGDFADASVSVADLDANGTMDILVTKPSGVSVVWNPSVDEAPAPAALIEGAGISAALTGDYNNDSLIDLLLIAGDEAQLHLNRGGQSFEAPQSLELGLDGAPLLTLNTDLNGDAKLDLISLAGGQMFNAINQSDAGNAMRVFLKGVRSAPSGRMSQLEVRSGVHYSYQQSQGGVMHAGLGSDDYAEVVRIEWTNGFIENKLLVESSESPFAWEESERISGSCPSVFTWDGEKFRYISDAFISGPMGVPIDRGVYFPITDRETMVVDGEAMQPLDGTLQMRFTEELLETVYLDRIELAVVEHPKGSVVAPHSRLAAPPSATEFYVARELIGVENVVDQNGKDQTEALAHRDGVYADNIVMDRQNIGFADPNSLTFTLPEGVEPEDVDALAARGWFYYFDSTAMIGEAQSQGMNIGFPMLHQKIDGQWAPVGPVGVMSGKDKVALMPLKGQLQSRELMLTSGIAIHWDELKLSLGDATDDVITTVLPLTEAEMRFRGLSEMTQRNPELFDYHQLQYRTMWNPMVGAYTAYGAVDEMVDDEDGIYAIFGTGDEIAFQWEQPERAPAEGMQYSYLIRFIGFVKDGDRYTSDGNRVDPLPFKGMSEYPAVMPADYRQPLAEMRRTRQPYDYTLSVMSKDKGK
ncbi:MAG: hypothetical protein ACPGNV_06550 [Mangrovicoccus sp.]